MKLIVCMFLALLMLAAVLLNTPAPPHEWREAAGAAAAVLTVGTCFALNWLSD